MTNTWSLTVPFRTKIISTKRNAVLLLVGLWFFYFFFLLFTFLFWLGASLCFCGGGMERVGSMFNFEVLTASSIQD